VAAPTTYTEATLAEYMHTALGAIATSLGWTVAGDSYDEPVNDALLLYGADDIASISGRASITKLRALARLAVWRKVVTETAGDYNFSADGGSYSRAQVNEQARQVVADLEYETAAYRTEHAATTQRVDFIHDPYAERTPEELYL